MGKFRAAMGRPVGKFALLASVSMTVIVGLAVAQQESLNSGEAEDSARQLDTVCGDRRQSSG